MTNWEAGIYSRRNADRKTGYPKPEGLRMAG